MSGAAPESLGDAAFDEADAPAGYRSRDAKSKFQTWFGLLVVTYVILQLVVPQVVQYTWMPEMFAFSGQMRIPRYEKAFVWKGEVWYPTVDPMKIIQGIYDLESMDAAGNVTPGRRMRITGGLGEGQFYLPQGDELWMLSPNKVVRLIPDHQPLVSSLQAANNPLSALVSPPILQDGVVTIVGSDAVGNDGLYQFENGMWVLKGIVNSVATPAELQPSPAGPPVTPPYGRDQYRLIEFGGRTAAFWRNGEDQRLRFSPELVLSPVPVKDEGAPADAWQPVRETVWQELEFACPTDWCVGVADGRLHVATLQTSPTSTVSVWRQENNGWKEISSRNVAAAESLVWLEGLDNEPTSLLTKRLSQGYELIPFRNGELGASIKGGGIFGSLMKNIVWLTVVLTIFGTVNMLTTVTLSDWLLRKYRSSTYSFGKETWELASFTRRGIARTIDQLLINTPGSIVFWMALSSFDVDEAMAAIKRDPLPFFMSLLWLVGVLFGSLLLGWIVYSITEGIWGLSPGKWICGVRVWRRTLRPCGVFRAAVRLVLLIVDGFFGYGIGLAAAGLSACRQRVGDMAMDTVVVRAGTCRFDGPPPGSLMQD